MILSIIVPMYNAKDFIGVCLDSLLNQNLSITDYEVLVVNDGSTDGSQTIVETYAKKYSNIVLCNQSNSGNGAARNKGIALAKGKYLYFLDADDYLADYVLEGLIKILENNNLDILGFNSVNTTSSQLNTPHNINIFEDVGNYKLTKGINFLADHNYRAEVWWYIVKTEYFKGTGISFYNRKFVQDSYITPSIFINAQRVMFIPLDAHRYRQNDNSITHIKSPKHIKKHMDDLIFSVNKLAHLIETVNNEKCILRLKNRQQGYVFFFLIRFAKSNMTFKALKDVINHLKLISAYPITHFIGEDYNGFKYRFLVFIFNKPLLLYPFLYMLRAVYRQKNRKQLQFD
ncbi:glycosyltransferase [Gelatiniphilus marinus]|uniref:Glycosyltransferase n=1 Tax=Gelatiniphilus marinus TaxID=1759464 RepID=A0ABW5JND9_9FLAO